MNRIFATSAVIIAGAVAAALIVFVPGWGNEVLVLSVATLLVLLAPIVYRLVDGKLDPFEPIFWFVLVWGVMFVVKPLQMLADGDTGLRNTYDVRAGMEAASVLGLVGAIAFVLVYEFVLRRRPVAPAGTPGPRRPPGWVTWATVALAGAGMFVLAGSSLTEAAATGSAAYQYLLPLLSIPAVLLLLVRARTVPGSSVLPAVAMLALSVVFFVFFGQRAFILMPASAAFVFFFLARERRPSWALLAAIAFLVILPVFTIIEASREHPGEGTVGALEKADVTSVAAAVSRFTEGDTTAMYPALALQMNTEGSVWERQPGHEIYSVTTRLIPAQLWPSKPRSSSEELYSRYFPAHYEINRAGTLFTLASEFYYDSGIAGVLIGMGLVGLAFAAMWRWVLARPGDVWAAALYAIVPGMSTIIFRGDLALSFGLALFLFGPVLAGYWLGARRRAAPAAGIETPGVGAT